MLSKKMIISIAGIAVSLVIALCVVLSLTSNKGNDAPKFLDITQSKIAIAYGDSYSVANIAKDFADYSFSVADANIAKIENNKIVTLACGKTTLYVSKNSSSKEIELVIYANTATFDKSSVNLHTSGADTTANFSFFINSLPYDNCEFSFDSNIISIENNSILAKTAGKTQILATMLGNFGNITASLNVNVKNYIYATNIIDDTIYMTVESKINKTFVEYENVVGDKIDAQFIYNNEYLSYENGVLSALKVGTTQITARALANENTTISKKITVEIAPKLAVAQSSFYKGDNKISTILYSTKADKTYETYRLNLAFNKPIFGEPTFSGIAVTNIEGTDAQTFDVTFTKADNSSIVVSATDPNTLEVKNIDLEITLQKFIQTVDFYLVDNNDTPRDTLSLFNNDYLNSANADNYYSNLKIITLIDNCVATNNFEIAKQSANIEIVKNDNTFVVNALSAGTATIKISATDGSGVQCAKNISVNKVIPTKIEFANISQNLFLYNTFSLKPTFEPAYALADFATTFENDETTSQCFSTTELYNYTATKCGTYAIKICENNSTFEHTYNLTILQKYIFIHNYTRYDSESAQITVAKDDTTSIEILNRTFDENNGIKTTANLDGVTLSVYDQNENLIYTVIPSQQDCSSSTCTQFVILENELYIINASVGEYLAQLEQAGKIVATLKIIIE